MLRGEGRLTDGCFFGETGRDILALETIRWSGRFEGVGGALRRPREIIVGSVVGQRGG